MPKNTPSCLLLPRADGRLAGLLRALAAAGEASIVATGTAGPELDIDTAPVAIDGVVLLRGRGASSLAAGTRAEDARGAGRRTGLRRLRSRPVPLDAATFAATARPGARPSGDDRDWAVPTCSLLSFAIVAFALVVAYPSISGSQSDAFKGISLFLGVLLSIGSSSAIAHIIPG